MTKRFKPPKWVKNVLLIVLGAALSMGVCLGTSLYCQYSIIHSSEVADCIRDGYDVYVDGILVKDDYDTSSLLRTHKVYKVDSEDEKVFLESTWVRPLFLYKIE